MFRSQLMRVRPQVSPLLQLAPFSLCKTLEDCNGLRQTWSQKKLLATPWSGVIIHSMIARRMLVIGCTGQ
jgi:hypothetical protein